MKVQVNVSMMVAGTVVVDVEGDSMTVMGHTLVEAPSASMIDECHVGVLATLDKKGHAQLTALASAQLLQEINKRSMHYLRSLGLVIDTEQVSQATQPTPTEKV